MQPAPVLPDARVGTTLCGKYHLERLLAVGGTASVYQGTHRNGHRVAVKVLHPEFAVNPEFRNRFLREGRVANRVEHPGATRVLDDDIDPEQGSVFLVMELLEGETLEARCESSGGLGHKEVASLTYQLLDTLVAAHEKGIVHRDIKPENLFLTRDGLLKVLDFGIAHLRLSEPPGSRTVTRVGVMMGTPAYLPPEQARGRTDQIDQRTDLWAVGATMFWLLSGRYVHEAETLEELLVFSGSRAARPLASVVRDAPAALSLIVDKALSFEKEGRFRTAREMQDVLAGAYPHLVDTLPRSDPASLPGYALGPNSSGSISIERGLGARPRVFTQPVQAASTLTSGDDRRPSKGGAGRLASSVSSRRFLFALAFVLLATALFSASQAGFRRLRSAPVLPVVSAVKTVADYQAALPEAAASSSLGLTAPAVHLAHSTAPLPPLSAPAVPATVSRRVAAPRTVPNNTCSPPYTVDGIGRRIPKPECL